MHSRPSSHLVSQEGDQTIAEAENVFHQEEEEKTHNLKVEDHHQAQMPILHQQEEGGAVTLKAIIKEKDMSSAPDSTCRGVAAAICRSLSEEDANQLVDRLRQYNNNLPDFRNADNDQDIRQAVYRWDERPPREIFQTGFTPRPQGSTEAADYYNLERFVNGGGSPGDTSQFISVFVSTTASTEWHPSVRRNCRLYRYQIYAPGGIEAVQISNFVNQGEISFAGGINPQYIRTALPFSFTVESDSQFPARYTTEWNGLIRNGCFNPNPSSDGGWTSQEFLARLRQPTCPPGKKALLKFTNMPRHDELKRDVEDKPAVEESYHEDPVCGVGHYIESAFNFSGTEEAYLFIADQCLLINYAPHSTRDYIIKGPQTIGDAFPCLKDTIFATGIDAAFTACTNEAYIFRSNIYARIKFTRDGGDIVSGPRKIRDGFHSLKNTIFAKGIDAAFASSPKDEAYIFKGCQYALINCAPGTTKDYIIQGPKNITDSFPSLRGTIFQYGFDAAFSSTIKNEAYIFKGDTYALINYAPGTTDDYIVNEPITPISKGFPSLKDIIPMYPCGC